MFQLLATTKCKRQQIAILIISFFAYVAGIRNDGNNMLLQQQVNLQQQQQITIENADSKSPVASLKQQSTLNFRPSQVIDFTPADAVLPQQYKPAYIEPPNSSSSSSSGKAIQYQNQKNTYKSVSQKQEAQSTNRRYTIEMAAAYGNAAEKAFSFPNEKQQIPPQHITDKPIYVYRDPFTNENYHYTPTEANVKETATIPTTYNHNHYNNDAYKQQHLHQHLQHYDDNQEYLVQSSMTVGTQQHQQQQQPQQHQETNPLRTYMSLSADKDVYLKRPGLVYDEKLNYNHPNSVTDKKTQVNKISYDSHDYPPPSYFEQQTSNFLPTPVPEKPSTSAPIAAPTAPPRASAYQNFRPPPHSTIFMQQQSSSQSVLPNYANSIDNYLLNKQLTSEFYRTERPPPAFSQQSPQILYQYESRPPPPSEHKQQYFAQPPSPHHQYEPARPPAIRPSYNNYYEYQKGEIPPQAQPSQHFNYPYSRPPAPPQYPYQGPYRPPAPPPTQQSGLATLAQYAPQFTSLLLGGGGGGNTNPSGSLGSLIGALTGATTPQQALSSYPASGNRRPVNSQLIKALENIARNDDLQCVPKVICQMIAAQTQRGQLPTFITSPTITNFLAGFPASSPALIYGRAALLGLSGGEKSCHQTYVNCPKDEYEIIYYLNNHRGGFFKFFSEPEEQQQTVNHASEQQSATPFFSILSAIAGVPQTTTTTPRPTRKPQASTADITSGIGNFFTHLLSDYVGGAAVEYQRRFKRSFDDKIRFEGHSEEDHPHAIKFQDEPLESQRDVFKFEDPHLAENEDIQQGNEEDFHDEEDQEDTQHSLDFVDGERDYTDLAEFKILNKNFGKGAVFFPEKKPILAEINAYEELKQQIKKYNDHNKEKKLKFPTATDDRMYTEVSKEKLRESKVLNDGKFHVEQNYGYRLRSYVQNSHDDSKKEMARKIKFIDYNEEEANGKQGESVHTNDIKDHANLNTNIIFPGRKGKIVNRFYYTPSYSQDYSQREQNQAPLTEQTDQFYTERPSPPSFNIYNTYTTSPTASTKIHHFLPTPPPQESDFSSTNTIYTNQHYSNNQHKQSFNFKYPSVGSSSTFYSNNNKSHKFDQLNLNRYHSSFYTTTRRPYATAATTEKPDSKNIYVTNSRGETEYYITPDGRKIYL